MSFSGNDDKLRIPIEIKTEDSKEIQELIQDISKAEGDLRQIRPLKGKADDSIFRGAVQTTPFDERGGIFSRFDTDDVLPSKLRDTKSKQAFTRENQFKNLQDKVNNLEETSADMNSTIVGLAQNLGLAGFLGGGAGAGAGAKASGAASGLSGIVGLGKGGVGKIGSAFTNITTKAFLPLFIASTVVEAVLAIVDLLQQPGGPFDKRYKRIIKDEIASATDRAEKAQIRQGVRLIRIGYHSTFRGEAFSGNGQAAAAGLPTMGQDFQARAKGML